MTGKMNWARVQKENQLRRRGSENMMVDAGLDGPTPVGRKKKLTKKKRRSDLKINAKTRIAQEIAVYKANPPPAKLIRAIIKPNAAVNIGTPLGEVSVRASRHPDLHFVIPRTQSQSHRQAALLAPCEVGAETAGDPEARRAKKPTGQPVYEVEQMGERLPSRLFTWRDPDSESPKLFYKCKRCKWIDAARGARSLEPVCISFCGHAPRSIFG